MFSLSKFHFTLKLKIKGQISAKKPVSVRQLIVTDLQAFNFWGYLIFDEILTNLYMYDMYNFVELCCTWSM